MATKKKSATRVKARKKSQKKEELYPTFVTFAVSTIAVLSLFVLGYLTSSASL